MSTDNTCANCSKGEECSGDLKSCTACKLVKYCNQDCQIAHILTSFIMDNTYKKERHNHSIRALTVTQRVMREWAFKSIGMATGKVNVMKDNPVLS